MKRILVTAGGTATAWHISNVAKEFFKDDIEVHVCDTNDSYLVPSVVVAKKVHKVPPVVASDYTDHIKRIVKEEGIDHIVPLIPQEAYLFAKDSDFVKENGITSSAASLKTTDMLADKLNMYKTLCAVGIPTPKVYNLDEIDPNELYLRKPRLGFGSLGVAVIKGAETIPEDSIYQQYCKSDDYDEITVEVCNTDDLRIFSRRRIATKAGVCVKAEPVDNEVFFPFIKKLVDNVECPAAFNVQFLRHNGEWLMFDCNLRLGAGTGLSTAIGFQLTRAFLADIVGIKAQDSWFDVNKNARSVLRVYQEIVIE